MPAYRRKAQCIATALGHITEEVQRRCKQKLKTSIYSLAPPLNRELHTHTSYAYTYVLWERMQSESPPPVTIAFGEKHKSGNVTKN